MLKVALSGLPTPHIYIDLRSLESYESSSLYGLLAEELNRLMPLWSRLLEYLKKVRGISVGPGGVSLSFGRERPSLIRVLKSLDEWAEDEGCHLPIVLDEAQELRFFRGGRRDLDFRRILAYSYDNLRRVIFILSGSEVGLLHDFFGLDDPKSPLFGRYHDEIPVERFNSETALEFLRRGFEYHGISPPEELLTRAVDEFDGIVGWLTYFGAEAVKAFKSGEALKIEEVFHDIRLKAVALSASELERLAARSMLYIGILACVGVEGSGWAEIKRSLEGRFRRTVAGRQLTTLLHNLERLSYILKDGALYRALDPISTEAAKLLISRRRYPYMP